jgi:hypothetical protein
MNKVSIALVAICLVTLHLMAQRAAGHGGDRNASDSRLVVARSALSGQNISVRQNLDGSVCCICLPA